MLDTLNRYGLEAAGRDRRFASMLALSLIWHVIFYGALFKLHRWSLERAAGKLNPEGAELVKLVDVAPAEKLPRLRRAPEPPERADTSRLRLQLRRPDDTALIERSPKPGQPGPGQAGSSRLPAPPPPQKLAQLEQAPAIESPQIAQAGLPQLPPPAPAETRPQGESSGRELALRQAQSQYIAYVRAKIYKVNEQIMPRRWIEEVLTEKVSAEFAVLLGRGGRILSAQLVRSSGYSTLDEIARQAIYTASPFEGWPQEAGETLSLTVTIYYSPWR